jgi:hypothetical protein
VLARLLHFRLDVAAYLKRSDEQLEGKFSGDSGLMSGAEARVYLTVLLENGVRFLPLDRACNNFHKDRGCMGHALENAEAAA